MAITEDHCIAALAAAPYVTSRSNIGTQRRKLSHTINWREYLMFLTLVMGFASTCSGHVMTSSVNGQATSGTSATSGQVGRQPKINLGADGRQRKATQNDLRGEPKTDRLNMVKRKQPEASSTNRQTENSDRKYIDLDELIALAADGHDLAYQLDQFIQVQQAKLDRLRRLSEEIHRDSIAAAVDTHADQRTFLGNAVNAFRMARRLAVDWKRTLDVDIRGFCNDSRGFLKAVNRTTENLPKPRNLLHLAKAIFRLQDTYNLTTDLVVRGHLALPVPVDSRSADVNRAIGQTTAQDSFELGRLAYTLSDYYHAVMWLEHCRRMLDGGNVPAADMAAETKTSSIRRAVLYDFLSHSLYSLGDVRGALKWTKKWLKLEPGHVRATTNKELYKQQLKRSATSAAGTASTEPFVNRRQLDEFRATDEFQRYERLCRGGNYDDEDRRRQSTRSEDDDDDSHNVDVLVCRHVTDHPSLWLSPGRAELINVDPSITIYHDVVTNAESEVIKLIAKSKFSASKVVPLGDLDVDKLDIRSSRTAWVSDEEHSLVARLSRKASILSGLTLDTADNFQVLSYGIGGHYVPHSDFLMERHINQSTSGNRIATFLCYLSDVTAGGATVFPKLEIDIPPHPGSCALWFNLLSNGLGDDRSRHASCPVLNGFKWAMNKWFRERGQEFTRPCLLGDVPRISQDQLQATDVV